LYAIGASTFAGQVEELHNIPDRYGVHSTGNHAQHVTQKREDGPVKKTIKWIGKEAPATSPTYERGSDERRSYPETKLEGPGVTRGEPRKSPNGKRWDQGGRSARAKVFPIARSRVNKKGAIFLNV